MVDILTLISETTSQNIASIVAAIVILLIGLVIGRFSGRLIYKVLNGLAVNRILKKEANINIPLEEAISGVVKYIIYLVSIILALNQLGITAFILQIILIIILVLIILFIVLALKDFIPNIVAGFYIHNKNLLKVNDLVIIKNIEGKVVKITPTEIKIVTNKGDTVFIPNAALIKTEIIKLKKR